MKHRHQQPRRIPNFYAYFTSASFPGATSSSGSTIAQLLQTPMISSTANLPSRCSLRRRQKKSTNVTNHTLAPTRKIHEPRPSVLPVRQLVTYHKSFQTPQRCCPVTAHPFRNRPRVQHKSSGAQDAAEHKRVQAASEGTVLRYRFD